MTEKCSQFVTVLLLAVLLAALAVFAWLKPADASSASERRKLAQRPHPTADTLSSGEFMAEFESYAADQFPLRDRFRSVKAVTSLYALRQKDNNGIYIQDGYAAKLEYPMDAEQVAFAAERFRSICDTYLTAENHVYLSLAPDKNYFLAAAHNCPAMDYGALLQILQDALPDANYLDIACRLSIADYYRTDTHWRQERLLDVARTLAEGMGVELTAEYETVTLPTPFYGVYYGQAALPLPPDTLRYLTNDTLRNSTVTSYDTSAPQPAAMYDLDGAAGQDPYDLFLSGGNALLVIENPSARTGRELILFRDSFGSSLAPLLVDAYAKITLVDIRYIHSAALGKFLEFDDQDVLFLYSPLTLNSGKIFR